MSDEYIAMRSASDASLKNDARLSAYKSKLAAATTVATAPLQELAVPDEQKKGGNISVRGTLGYMMGWTVDRPCIIEHRGHPSPVTLPCSIIHGGTEQNIPTST